MKNEFWRRIFAIRKCNEEGTQWAICIGNKRAIERFFDTKEEAEEFISRPNWEALFSLILCTCELVIDDYLKQKTENNEEANR